ncbi:DUF1440 domain-containing protein [Terriglobus albidus]|uniref:DUF1440 domain-containing protein n=1 Tax=Terriglobus albidus TaxID=1592106 RepID=UPI0021E07B68|nr:DUF1440 domain-containing protein [Terriglobus albidus]
MSNAKPNLLKGLLAGVAAGLVATAAKGLVEKFYPPHTHGELEPSEILTEKLAGHLPPSTKAAAAQTIHWGFGAAAGGAYGMLAELYPAATARNGAQFGVVLATLTHESVYPKLGLAAEPKDQDVRERSSEMISHVVYGVVTETVRSVIRRVL